MTGADYLRDHGVDLDVAQHLGIECGDTYVDWPTADYFRRRYLAGRWAGDVMPVRDGRIVSGVTVAPWAPMPIDGWLLVCEGESDTTAAVSTLYELYNLADEGDEPDVELFRRDDLPPPLKDATPVGLPGAGSCHDEIVALAQQHVADVVVLLDGDAAGRAAAQRLADKCREAGVCVAIADPGEDRDLCDVLVAADDPAEALANLIAEAEAVANTDDISAEGEQPDADQGEAKQDRPPPQSAIILQLAQAAGVECWATPAGEPFLTAEVDGHREHHRLGSRASRDYLARLYFLSADRAPSAQALQDALGVLRGEALFGAGERVEAHVRHAATEDAIYIDLGDAEWRAVEITAAGWKIVTDAPVRFRRPRGMLPLPDPIHGAPLTELFELLNVSGERDRKLITGFLVGALAPTGPYPVLGLHGEAGAAKSSAARLTRSLLDPNSAPLRSEPRDERDLVIAASNGRVVALDNLSRLSGPLSDALCRLATGGGFATRELYSDSEEIIFSATRPAIITAIAEVATRGDLLDRSIQVTLEAIPESARLTEAELEGRWDKLAPELLGALFDAASTGLRRRGEVELARLPRMADHVVWVEAAAPALGWEAGEYLAAYREARAEAVETALEASPLTNPIRDLAEHGWKGTATDLLAVLGEAVEDAVTRQKSWPKSPRTLSAALRRLAPDLRSEGIAVESTRAHGGRRVLQIGQVANLASPASPSSPSALESQISGDADGDANGAGDAKIPPGDASDSAHRHRSNGSVEPKSAPGDAGDATSPLHPDLASPGEEEEAERIAEKFENIGAGGDPDRWMRENVDRFSMGSAP